MIVVTYTPNESGPVLQKSKVVISRRWPIYISGVGVADSHDDLRRMFATAKMDYIVNYEPVQDYLVTRVTSLAYRCLAALVLIECRSLKVVTEGSNVFVEFVDTDEAFRIIKLDPDGYGWENGQPKSEHIARAIDTALMEAYELESVQTTVFDGTTHKKRSKK